MMRLECFSSARTQVKVHMEISGTNVISPVSNLPETCAHIVNILWKCRAIKALMAKCHRAYSAEACNWLTSVSLSSS